MPITYENHDQCPLCKEITLPKFDDPIVKAVKCQNRACGCVIKKKEDKKNA